MRKSNRLKNDRTYIAQNAAIDSQLYGQLRSLNIVTSTDQLSILCGRNPSYVRCMRSKGLGMKLGSLTVLRERLAQRMETEADPTSAIIAGYAMKAVEQTIREKCRIHDERLSGSGRHTTTWR
jgi:hypothetical protein